ncbi:cyanophycinase [Chitinophagaceae bacterium LB-8]|uniref:Cyanophycinase n=1 Tax=Paraflavisolibacter caeni TaxID=2982496 RepID=A0A9X2XSP3_9BACT|nr:cyanophycinase [Paraflavisolibacter caeni]MCU7547531.1 cyanophycinase [Paraflavisolibacter caeni]
MIIPNGKLIAVGGAEQRVTKHLVSGLGTKELAHFIENGILRRIVDEAGGVNARIEVITTASSIPVERGNEYLESFATIGCQNVGVMHIRSRADINEGYFQRIRDCDGIMFTGGTQKRLGTVFHKTEFLHAIRSRYQKEHLLVAGTSAGAMAMGLVMIYKGTAMFTHLKGHVKIMHGLHFIDNVIFDSHFERSGRFARLAQVVALHPESIGIGLGEDTGIVVSEGNHIEVIGSGWVTIIDGSEMRHSDILDIQDNHTPSMENVKVHICKKGNGFLIEERRFLKEVRAPKHTPGSA